MRSRRIPAAVFRYLSFKDPRLKTTFRLPLVPVRIRAGNGSLKTVALVDSGATSTFVPFELLHILGLDVTQVEQVEVVGAGGTFMARPIELNSLEIVKSDKNL